MRLLLNVLWVVIGGGLVTCLEYLLAGLLLCLTIVGIPFGLQCFKLAGLALWPFGKEVTDRPGSSPISLGLNIFWIIVAGFWILLTHLGLALGLAVTIIGLPFAWQHLKFASLALMPFGREVRRLP